MINKALYELLWILVLALITGILIAGTGQDARNADIEKRIEALEQSQCSIKQDKVHADYKLNVCIAHLRSKP